ncbi:hypothetical protein [Shinella sp.]|uniref:hypothetical protein n=1 Tax=Shinella sp. TaxID=1870904 RepID=UPI0029B2FA0D|nr:hypothetical protein [Shinella sp.]MDX3975778.1 hypothetical protein [Shinella sp.]
MLEPLDPSSRYPFREIAYKSSGLRWHALFRPATALYQQLAKKAEPLVPATTRRDRSIEDVAREKAVPVFKQRFEPVESVAQHVFRDPARSPAGPLMVSYFPKLEGMHYGTSSTRQRHDD